MKNSLIVGLVAASAPFLGGCSSTPQTSSERATMRSDSSSAMADFKSQDPTVSDLIQNSYGYAIFPSVGKGAVGVGGAYGDGEVFEQGNRVGYATMTQGTIGVALGGQTFAELIIFQNRDALQQFKSGNLEFAADATAVAIKSGAGAAAKFQNHVVTFISVKGGLMADASIGGQKFTFKPL